MLDVILNALMTALKDHPTETMALLTRFVDLLEKHPELVAALTALINKAAK